MKCERVDLGNGAFAIACSRGQRQSRKCSGCGAHVSDGVLCDYPLKTGKTCDRHCCRACSQNVGPNKDYCSVHAKKNTARTTVVNIHRDSYDVYIGRAGRGHDGFFGNPIVPGRPCPVCEDVHDAGGDTLACFRVLFDRVVADVDGRARIEELRGKRLGCFCKPNPCHGDVIAAYLNGET